MIYTHLFGNFPLNYSNFTFSYQFQQQQKKIKIIFIEIYAVLWLAKRVAIYKFLLCKIPDQKIRSCKIFEKFQLWMLIAITSIGKPIDPRTTEYLGDLDTIHILETRQAGY